MTTISRYLVSRFLRTLAACWLTAGLVLFLLEAFGKMANLDAYDAPAGAIGAYLLLKIPNLMLDAYPATTLFAVLVSLGLLVRTNEILAARACGVSRWRMLRALLAAALGVSVLALAWTEYVVPSSSSRSRLIRDTVIKRREAFGGPEGAAIWVRAPQGFLRIEYFDRDRSEMLGVTLFRSDPAMRLREVVEGPSAYWTSGEWKLRDGTVRTIDSSGNVVTRDARAEDFPVVEPPLTFEKRRPKPKEMTFAELSRFIRGTAARGASTEEFRVERHLRLAWPATALVAVLIGFPLATRGGRNSSLGYNVALGLFVGFAYWVCFAIFASAGRSGSLVPVLAAWGPNALFTAVGIGLLTRREG